MIEYYEDAAGEWRWRLKGANGEIVCTGEGHRDKHDAQRAAHGAAVSMMRAIAGDDWVPVSGDLRASIDIARASHIRIEPGWVAVERIVRDEGGNPVVVDGESRLARDTETVQLTGPATRMLLIDEGEPEPSKVKRREPSPALPQHPFSEDILQPAFCEYCGYHKAKHQ